MSEGRPTSDRELGAADRHPVRPALRVALGDAARRDGLRLRDEVLTPLAGVAGDRGVGAPASDSAGVLIRSKRDRLEPGEPGQRVCVGSKRGSVTSLNPTDRELIFGASRAPRGGGRLPHWVSRRPSRHSAGRRGFQRSISRRTYHPAARCSARGWACRSASSRAQGCSRTHPESARGSYRGS